LTVAEYRNKRALALRIFGFVMLFFSVSLLIVSPRMAIREKKYCTAWVTGEVVSVEGEDIRIYYELPGEGETWYVTMHGTGWKKDDKVKVFYNPADLSEKYIEGWEASPWEDVPLILFGAAMGIGALYLSKAARKKETVNEVLDVVDRAIR
jgi:hypothetical protein